MPNGTYGGVRGRPFAGPTYSIPLVPPNHGLSVSNRLI